MSRVTRIVLWKPSKLLLKNVEKLDFSNSIEAIFGKEIYDVKYRVYDEIDIKTADYDIVLISFEDFRKTRRFLNETYNIAIEKIYTFEEYWVKDCERMIVTKYHDRWKKVLNAKMGMLENKTVVIMGGSSGIGKECARCFLCNGANVIIVGRNLQNMHMICEEYNEYGNIKYMQWNVNQYEQYQEKFSMLLELVTGQIDILINSVGILDGIDKDFFHVTEKDFDDTINTNLKATYFLCQIFSRYYYENKIRGHIVNVVSSLGFLPTVKPYAISKWGVVGLTKGLGLNLAEYGIIVNGVAPGEVATPILKWTEGNCPARRAHKNGRIAFACEVAETILYLAGYTGENFVGEVVVCDGGDKSTGMAL